jgi:hypothetical protein
MAALLASALAGALVGATLTGPVGVAVGVAVLQLLLVLGLQRSSGLPALRASGAVALVAGVGSSVLVLLRPQVLLPQSLEPLVAFAGLGMVAMAVVQLARRDGRAQLTDSLTTAVTMLALSVIAATWVGLAVAPAGPAVMLVALAGVAVAVAFDVFPGPRWLWVVGGTIAAAGAGLLVQTYAPQATEAALAPGPAALVAAAAGLAATAGLGVARRLVPPGGTGSALLIAAVPLLIAAPVVVGVGLLVVD